MRRAAVAGRFYPKDSERLNQTIHNYVNQIQDQNKDATAAVSPHAGYKFSGDLAAKSIASLKAADSYIIIGPSHQGAGIGVSLSEQTWETPLGEVEINQKITEELKGIGVVEEKAHTGEHSIEVQIPFLQYFQEDFDIVPIMLSMQDIETVSELSKKISDLMNEKNIAIISSSDFSHYQPKEVAENQDREAISKIKELNVTGFYNLIEKNNLSICGYGPISVSMNIAKQNKLDPKLLEYKTSADITGDASQVVGYASIVFK